MKRSPILLLLLAVAACGGGATTVEVTRTLEATTTVEVTVTTEPEEAGEDEAAAGLDADDVPGPLDVQALEAVRAGDLLTVNVEMWGAWDPAVLAGASALVPGASRLTILYDVDLDGRVDYRGPLLVGEEGVPSLVIMGSGQAFEPVPVPDRPSPTRIELTHPVDVLFVEAGQEDVESEVTMQVAVVTEHEGARDRAPDEGWLLVPFR